MADSDVGAGFIRRHQLAVWRFLRVLGCDPAEAKALSVEVFVQFFAQPCEHYSTRFTTAYLLDLARQLLIRDRKRRKLPVPEAVRAEWHRLEAEWTRLAGRDGGESLQERLAETLDDADPRLKQLLRAAWFSAAEPAAPPSDAEAAALLDLVEKLRGAIVPRPET